MAQNEDSYHLHIRKCTFLWYLTYLDVMWSHPKFVGSITSEKCIVVFTSDVVNLQNWIIGWSQEVWSMQSLGFHQMLASISVPMSNFLHWIIGFSFEVPRKFNFGYAGGPASQKSGGAPGKGQFGKLRPPIDNGRICKQFQDPNYKSYIYSSDKWNVRAIVFRLTFQGRQGIRSGKGFGKGYKIEGTLT